MLVLYIGVNEVDLSPWTAKYDHLYLVWKYVFWYPLIL